MEAFLVAAEPLITPPDNLPFRDTVIAQMTALAKFFQTTPGGRTITDLIAVAQTDAALADASVRIGSFLGGRWPAHTFRPHRKQESFAMVSTSAASVCATAIRSVIVLPPNRSSRLLTTFRFATPLSLR